MSFVFNTTLNTTSSFLAIVDNVFWLISKLAFDEGSVNLICAMMFPSETTFSSL
jgi:hypothetical protein